MSETNNLPTVSVVVLNYNGKKWLKNCLESLNNLEYPKDKYEVILGDNASFDDSVEYVKKNFPWVRVLEFNQNYGFCEGNNLCAKEAKGEYLIFLNNDTFVEKKWMKEFIKGVLSEKDVIACACKMLSLATINGKKIINTAGGTIFPDGCGHYYGFLEQDSEKYNHPKYVGFACGAGVLIKKDFFLSTGGFDPYFYYTGEEVDLGMRVWMYGYKVLYVPSAIMYHVGGGTDTVDGKGITSPSVESIITRNKMYFILKNFEFFDVLKGLILFFVRNLAMVIYNVITKNPNIIIAIIKGNILVVRDLIKKKKREEILKSRRNIKKNRVRSDNDLRRLGVICSVKEWIRLYLEALKNMKKIRNGVFSRKDSVKIRNINDKIQFIQFKKR